MIPTVLLASIIIFLIMRFIPGDIVALMVANQEGDVRELMATIRHNLGLDVPIYIQYARWMGDIIIHGDLGVSLWKGTPVIEEIAARWPVTLELSILGLIIGQLIAIPIGIYSALRQDKWGDYIGRSFAILCISVPGFWLGTMIIVFPSIWWGYMPSIMLIPFTEDPLGNLKMFIIPAVVLGMALSGATMRMTRTMVLEVLRQDYIRTAWGKGLRERVIVIRHALKNALIPVVTVIGMQVPILVGGSVIIEQIFCLPGIARLTVSAITERDYPIVSGVMLLFAVALVLINLMVDLTYGYLDPRVHYK